MEVVARRLDKLLPSHWREQLRPGNASLPFDKWLEVVPGEPVDNDHWWDFWYAHDLEALASRGLAVAGAGRLTFVVLDEDDRTSRPSPFERLLGLPAGLLAPDVGHRVNASVGRDRVEMLRRLKAALEDKHWPAEVSEMLRARVARRTALRNPWPGVAPPTSFMPAWARDRVAELDEKRAALMRSPDIRVFGEPGALTRTLDSRHEPLGPASDLVSSELAVDAVLSAMAAASRS